MRTRYQEQRHQRRRARERRRGPVYIPIDEDEEDNVDPIPIRKSHAPVKSEVPEYPIDYTTDDVKMMFDGNFPDHHVSTMSQLHLRRVEVPLEPQESQESQDPEEPETIHYTDEEIQRIKSADFADKVVN